MFFASSLKNRFLKKRHARLSSNRWLSPYPMSRSLPSRVGLLNFVYLTVGLVVPFDSPRKLGRFVSSGSANAANMSILLFLCMDLTDLKLCFYNLFNRDLTNSWRMSACVRALAAATATSGRSCMSFLLILTCCVQKQFGDTSERATLVAFRKQSSCIQLLMCSLKFLSKKIQPVVGTQETHRARWCHTAIIFDLHQSLSVLCKALILRWCGRSLLRRLRGGPVRGAKEPSVRSACCTRRNF